LMIINVHYSTNKEMLLVTNNFFSIDLLWRPNLCVCIGFLSIDDSCRSYCALNEFRKYPCFTLSLALSCYRNFHTSGINFNN
jgi:hypothetical protein